MKDSSNDCMKVHLNYNSPIFVVGMPRSGTTLMNTILSAHPSIAIPLSETKFLVDLEKNNRNLAENKPRDFAAFWENYVRGERFTRLGIDADRVYSRISTTGEYDYKSIFASILQEYALKMDKPRWGEKTPDHYRYANTLLDWYPQAKIIWMLRDPRSVITSLLNVPWSKRSIEAYAQKWCDSVDDFEQQWATDNRIKLVKYEALVLNPASELKLVCQFLNEEFVPTMFADRSESTSPIINRSEEDKTFFQQTLRPVDQNSLEKWRSDLSSAQVATVESITRSKMLQYDYKPITNSFNRQAVRLFIDRGWRKAKRAGEKMVWTR